MAKKNLSVIKRQKQNEKRNLKNRSIKSEIKTHIKKVNTLVEAGDMEKAKKAMVALTSKLDKAAKKGVLHKNTASNKKSKITKKINKTRKKD